MNSREGRQDQQRQVTAVTAAAGALRRQGKGRDGGSWAAGQGILARSKPRAREAAIERDAVAGRTAEGESDIGGTFFR